jgi:RNA polymerase-binding transcription factor DksA
MNHLTEEQMQDLRDQLDAERATIEQELRDHGVKEGGEWDASSKGFEGEESDPNDVADQIEELVTNVPIEAQMKQRAQEIDDALGKMNAGTYGICEVGGEEIPYDRLQANPAARTCLAHA